jgi:hypothetical protein
MSRTQRLNLQRLESREVPTSDLAYALQLTGLPASSVTHVAADPIGNVYVTGTFSGTVDLNPDPKVTASLTSHGGTDIFVAKYGTNGQFLWADQLGGAADDSVSDIALDGIANVYIGGTFNGAVDFNPAVNVANVATASTGGSAFLWKLSYSGNFLMARTVAGTSSISNIAVDPPGNILATGQFTGTADFDPSANTANLITSNANGAAFAWKLDQTGAYAWSKAFQSTGTIQSSAVAIDGQGHAYLAGRFTGTADLDPSDTARDLYAAGTNWMPFVVKLDSLGNHIWADTLRTATPVVGAPNAIDALGVDGIGNVYTAGVFAGTLDFDPGTGIVGMTSANALPDGFVWKLNGDGSLGYARKFGGVNAETVSDLAVDKSGQAYVTGTFTGIADFDPSAAVANLTSGSGVADTYVLKLNSAGNLAYTRAFGGGLSTTRGTGIYADGVGNMYLTGTVYGTGDFDPGNRLYTIQGNTGSGFIVKLSPAFNTPVKPTNLPPTNISAGGPYTINEGAGLTVKAAATDPEGQPLTFNWDLNGDGIYGDAFGWKVVLSPAQMQALGLNDGTGIPRTIHVRVNDGVNLAVVATSTLTINNVAPVAQIVLPATGTEGVRPQVSFKVISEPSNRDRNAGFRASWDFNDDGVWDLGDGTSYAGSVAGAQKIPMSFVSDSGPLAVHVRVFDKDGGYSDSTATIMINEVAPTAMFSMVGTATVGNPVTFQFTNQKDSPADMAAGFTYGFDFNGDGEFEVQGTNPQASTVFQAQGTYTVNGAIIDKDGTYSVYQLTVNVM